MPLLHTSVFPTGAKFSASHAERVINFIERAGVHTKGPWSKKAFELYPWQKGSVHKGPDGLWHCEGIITPLFGAVQWDEMLKMWVRQFSLAWIEVARKNGKSELMAILGLYLLIFDGEESAEIYSAASDRDQAAMVFNVARDMIKLSPMLSRMREQKIIEVIDSRKTIVYTPTRSTYKVVSADAAGNLGANPHAILFDEVLAQPDEKLWDYLRQGEGTRAQTLLIGVTTAGNDDTSFAYREHEFSIRVAEDPDIDPARFVYMAFVDENANWTDEALWPEANPAIGQFLNWRTLRKEYKEVVNKGDLSQISNFRQFRLNQWQKQADRWLDMLVWNESGEATGEWTIENLNGLNGYGGLDLSETLDLTAWVMVFPTQERTYVLPRFWITRKALNTRHKKLAAVMENWQAAGYIKIFEKDVIDYAEVTEDIIRDLESFNVRMIGYDQYQAPAVVQQIENRTDATCVKIPQSTTRLNAASKELTRILGERQLAHNHNPVLRWNADNAAYQQDSDGNIKPSKKQSPNKIDGITATVNALAVQLIDDGNDGFNLYVQIDCPHCGATDTSDYDEDLEVYLCRNCGRTWNNV
jgi:phage terminase large subunit-like protein